MPTPTLEPRLLPIPRAVRTGPAVVALALLAAGCGHSDQGGKSASPKAAEGEAGKTAGIRVVRPERRDIRMMVVQPGTIQAFEVTPVYPRIAGYVEKYRFNIGDRVKTGDILLDMWIPDFDEQLAQKAAAVKRAEVQIRVTQSALQAAEAKLETAKARILSAEAGVKRAQASYTRWESEYKRLETLVAQRVLDVQVRDETYRQFEEAAAAPSTRPTRWSPRRPPRATRRPPTATRPASTSRPPAPTWSSPRPTSGRPRSWSITATSRPPMTA